MLGAVLDAKGVEMAISSDKTRISVTIGNDLLENLDAYCKRTGLTRSAYISYVVASSLDASSQLVSRVASIASDKLTDVVEEYGPRPA